MDSSVWIDLMLNVDGEKAPIIKALGESAKNAGILSFLLRPPGFVRRGAGLADKVIRHGGGI